MTRESTHGPALLFALAALACSPAAERAMPEEDPQARAERLARELVIVDTHVDYPYAQRDRPADISTRAEGRNFDYPKAHAGGLDVAFMSIYIPAAYQQTGGAGQLADELIDMVEKLAADHPDKFAIARSPADVEAQFGRGVVSLAMGMENGEPIEGDLANVARFFDRGIRYIGLAHSENNHLSDSSYAEERQWNGLSPFGKEVVAEMNRLGIMIDVSHLSDDAFEQIMELSRAPVIASHSSCRRFTPDWERNIGDDMIRRLAASGGVVQVNFGSAFLTAAANQQSSEYWAGYRTFLDEHELAPDSEEARQYGDRFWSEHERIYATLADVADHIDHVVALAGIDHVGFGSDFDGVGDSLPEGLKDASGYPNLLRVLIDRGYSDEDLAKIAGGNLLRVWREVERLAAESPGS